MSSALLSSRQREILEALADHWVLQRWACRDGHRRWHMGEDEVDGRSVEGLRRRGLVAWHWRMDGELVLTDAGRVALGVTYTVSGAPDASVDDQGASPAHDAAGEER